MPEGILLPKFLTKEVGLAAIRYVITPLLLSDSVPLKRKECHAAILVPSMKDDRPSYPSYPNYIVEPYLLAEESFGDKSNWEYPYDSIAQCKGLQLWHDRNDDQTDIMPHLLFPGDTPYWGGVKRHKIVVAVSGFQPYFDKMISGMIADMCKGMAYHAWMTSEDKEKGLSFLL